MVSLDIDLSFRNFIKDWSSNNIKERNVGSIRFFKIKKPKLVFFISKNDKKLFDLDLRVVRYENIYYKESDFIRLLKLRVFW